MMAGGPPECPPGKNRSPTAKTRPALVRRLLVVSQSEPAEKPVLHMGHQGGKKQELQNAKIQIESITGKLIHLLHSDTLK